MSTEKLNPPPIRIAEGVVLWVWEKEYNLFISFKDEAGVPINLSKKWREENELEVKHCLNRDMEEEGWIGVSYIGGDYCLPRDKFIHVNLQDECILEIMPIIRHDYGYIHPSLKKT